jgi:hypothetical protein
VPDVESPTIGIHAVKESEKNNSIYPNVLKGYKIETNRWLSGVEAPLRLLKPD